MDIVVCFALFLAAMLFCLVKGFSLAWALLFALVLFFALGLRSGRLLEVGLDFGDERVLEADVDLLGSGRCLEQASDLLVALLLGSLGECGVLRGGARFAGDGSLQVLERSADFAGAEAVHVRGVLGGGDFGTYLHG